MATLNGTNGEDNITGTSGNDTISSGNGNDTVSGGAGNDTIDGGNGDDVLLGGTGDDTLLGGNGNDILAGQEGNDLLLGGKGNDYLEGNEGADTLKGEEGDDTLVYTLDTTGVTDVYDGGKNNDTLVLRLTVAQQNEFANQIDAFKQFLALYANAGSANGLVFTFDFGNNTVLKVSNIEKLKIETLNNGNADPIAEDDVINAQEDQTILINPATLLQNDHDPDNDTLTLESVGNSLNGVATLLTSGPDAGKIQFVPNANFNGNNAGFDYLISDGQGHTDIGHVQVIVAPVNDPASITGTPTGAVKEDVTLSASGVLTVSDVDAGEAKFAAESNVNSDNGLGKFTITANGNWTYALTNNLPAVQQLKEGQTLTDTHTFTSFDGTASQVVTITITGTNDAAIVTGGTNIGNLTEDTQLFTSGTLNISDVDSGESAFLTEAHAGDNGYGNFSITPSGAWTMVLNNNLLAIQQLPASGSQIPQLLDSYTFHSVDGTAFTLIMRIFGTNDAAAIGGDATADVKEDTILSASADLTITDVDTGESKFAIESNITGDNAYGLFSINALGHWTYSLDNNLPAIQHLPEGGTLTDTHTFHSFDGTASQMVTVTITGTNDAASISGTSTDDVNVIEDDDLSASGVLTISDIDGAAEEKFAAENSVLSDHGYGNFSIDVNGNWSYLLNNSLLAVQKLPQGGTLTDTHTFHSVDGTAKEVTVTIAGTNDAASVFTVIGGTAAIEDVKDTSGIIRISDIDLGENKFNEGFLQGEYGLFALNHLNNNNFVWTYILSNNLLAVQQLGEGDELTDSTTFTSLDGTASLPISVLIKGTNDEAIITGESTGTVKEDDTILIASGTLNISDVDLGENSFVIETDIAGENGYGLFSIDALGNWTYTLDNDSAAVQDLNEGETLTDTHTVFSLDGTASQEISVTINGTDEPSNVSPVIDENHINGTEDQSITFSLLDAVSDPDGDPISLVNFASTSQFGGTIELIDALNGIVKYTPAANFSNSYFGTAITDDDSFSFSVQDDHGHVISGTMNIAVQMTDDAPVAVDDRILTNNDGFSAPYFGSLTVAQLLANDYDVDIGIYANFPIPNTFSLQGSFFGPFTSLQGQIGPDGNPYLPISLSYDAQSGMVNYSIGGFFSPFGPPPNSFGFAAFQYNITADMGQFAGMPSTATVLIVPNIPIAVNDSYDVSENGSLFVDAIQGVAINDTDYNGQLLVDPDNLYPSLSNLNISLLQGPAHGQMYYFNPGGDFGYAPTLGFSGLDSFTYKITYVNQFSQNVYLTGTVNINVIHENQAPTAIEDVYTMHHNETHLHVAAPGVLANDLDENAASLQASITSSPFAPTPKGSIILNSNGSFDYTPNGMGLDQFVYIATDSAGLISNPSFIYIFVVNDAPIGELDSFNMNEDTSLSLTTAQLLANDHDYENDAMSFVSVQNALNGVVSLNGSNILFTPDANFYGTASFEYILQDALGEMNTGHVEINVANDLADTPVANNDAYTMNEDGSLSKDAATGVMSNDVHLDSLTAIASLMVGPEHGLLTLNEDGSFDYAPEANYNGSDSFTYKINDGNADSNIATVLLTINAVNDAPVGNEDSYSLNEDSVLTIPSSGVLSNDTDIDTASASLSAILVSGPTHGNLTLNSNGSFTYTPALNYNGSDSFSYKANDGALNSATTLVTLTIAAQPDPTIANNDQFTIAEDNVLISSVRTNDTDADGFPLTASLISGPSHGVLDFHSDGTFIYTPIPNYYNNFNNFQVLPADSFTYRVTDGNSEATATAFISVTSVNDLPLLYINNTNNSLVTNEGSSLKMIVGSDAEGPLVAQILDATSQFVTISAGQTVNLGASGNITYNTEIISNLVVGSFTYDPAVTFTGNASFTFRLTDGPIADIVGPVTINIAVAPAINDPPVVMNDSYSANEDSALIIAAASGVLANDHDPDSTALNAILVDNPFSGTVTLNPDGSFVYTPFANFNGHDSFTYLANDGSLNSSLATVDINVLPVNDAPVAVNDSYNAIPHFKYGNQIQFGVDITNANGVLANDTDIDNNLGSLAISQLVSTTSHGTLTLIVNQQGYMLGGFDYIPDEDFIGIDSFTYTVTDGSGISNIATVFINVSGTATSLFHDTSDFRNFNIITPNQYLDGTQYNALNGDDFVVLPDNATAAAAAGFDQSQAFHGGLGDDFIMGGSGNDIIHGDEGNDRLFGKGNGFAPITISALNTGNDSLNGGAGNDTLFGGDGSDILSGGDGFDIVAYNFFAILPGSIVGHVDASTGNYIIDKSIGGSDIIMTDVERIEGTPLNDIFSMTEGRDLEIRGGNGFDIVDYRLSSVAISIAAMDTVSSGNEYQVFKTGYGTDLLSNITQIIGSNFGETLDPGTLYVYDDNINGAGGNDTILGRDGNDTLAGGDGHDVLIGGNGNDILSGDDGNDALYGDDGDDIINGNLGEDQLHGGAGNDLLHGGMDDDTIVGSAGNDTIYGDEGDDALSGDIGNDIVYGGDGNDLIAEFEEDGAGNDIYHGDDGDDFIVAGLGIDELYGDAGNDILIGAGEDTLHGGDGNDELYALYNGFTSDILFGDGGDDILHGSFGDDVIVTLDINNNIVRTSALQGGDGNDTIYGYDGNDLLDGGDGDDLLIGGGQADVLRGGAGNDTLMIETYSDNIIDGTVGSDSIPLGTNRLYGGEGADTFKLDQFVYPPSGATLFEDYWPDYIRDFTVGEDIIDLHNAMAGLPETAEVFLIPTTVSGSLGDPSIHTVTNIFISPTGSPNADDSYIIAVVENVVLHNSDILI